MIRGATPDDIASFIALQTRVEQADELLGYRVDAERAWRERSLVWSFVATSDDGEPVGFIYCAPRAYDGECVFPAGSRILEILELVVDAGHRDSGVGRELVMTARDRARQDGFSHLRVYSAARRFDDVLRFYRSCGFSPWSVELTTATE